MKCEHDGCGREARAAIRVEHRSADFGWHAGARSIAVCDEHLPWLLRSRADEVEGVRDCETCEGEGYVGTYEDYEKCGCCHGTGKVPR
jgi:hypothetical protein